ncbi:MAG: hypothetical protein KW806_01820, partial [Candidatus Yanofskybacteria bacterium]|nr:hypothetical protein [Candidatus Yanofskybacteria bacterium]
MKDYWVSVTNDEWVTPEETLLDSGSGYSDLEKPIVDGIFRFGLIFALGIGLIIAGYSGYMSVVKNKQYAALAYRNRTVNLALTPPRGLIYDYAGTPLVQNAPSFDLLLVNRELTRQLVTREEQARSVAAALGISPDEFWEKVQAGSKNSAVFFGAVDLTKEQVLALHELNPEGYHVITSTKRVYPKGQQFSSIVGYTGKVNAKDLEEDNYYLSADTIGRAGIEATYEETLRGQHGTMYFTANEEEIARDTDPVAGNSLVLNINAQAQEELWREMNSVLRSAGLTSGAAVVQDPRSGAVLALVSFPTYDNNIFTKEISKEDAVQLFQSSTRPLFNRAISGRYNPGSTIKPYIGLASLEEKIMGPEDTIHDCISISIPNPSDPEHPYIYKNWRVDLGLFNLRRAIANSCNVYFFSVGGGFGDIRGLGVNKIVQYLQKGWANLKLGIDLPGEEAGFVPTPEWKEKNRHEPWYQGDTFNISIGQGDLLVTPLWINTYVSAIANGGTLNKPQVANRVIDQNKKTLEIKNPTELGK